MEILTGTESTEQFLSGGGEMGKLIRTMDWSKTALGPISSWPQSLRTSVSLCLSSTFPILIAWGPETIQIYNDSYRPICGAKHPQSMGENFRICWETALPVVGDKFTRGEQGEGTYITDQRMFLDRYGYLEEAFMTFSFAPIRDESGGVGGIFHPITETTEKMLSGRRTQVLRDLGASMGKAKSVQEIGALTLAQYEAYALDLPFMCFYELEQEGAKLISSAGVPSGSVLAPLNLSFQQLAWPIQEVFAGGLITAVNDLQERFGDFNCGPYEQPPHTAMILPLRISGQTEIFGFIIAGVSVCRALDPSYLNFYEQLTATYNTAISNIYAYEQEQKRAEALAEIDRAKTAFFSNVSHEFRTPLTLMLGPLEELLQEQGLTAPHKAQLEATHRNALRLLKLVNNLLDYSRVEAGRIQAVYQPVDLTEMTTDLASSFRSIIEKAGMQIHVSCRHLEETYYADRQMWEKIVLNLLSNAFKYTLEGCITVSLTEQDGQAVLKVTDTGVGIPENELPHMFERFHRVENAAGRTHEGTGIGLSLVHELVQLHGGEIVVASIEGEGSTFTVTLPSGKSHLPAEQVIERKRETDTTAVKGAFIKEAYSLLQDTVTLASGAAGKTTGNTSSSEDRSLDKDTQILLVDDNQDMRNYLKRLLDPYFTVEMAVNGKDALTKIADRMPDLVLSDMMMPVMDGKTMLQLIRANDKTMRLPVIFLSARAGEEARIDGLKAGADDYLVKPFSAAELLTKVHAQIHIGKTRGHAEQQLRTLLKEAPVAMVIYRGPNHVIEMANTRMLDYWGRTEGETFGIPLFEAIPELELQGYHQMMDKVYLTGERFISGEVSVLLNRFGKEEVIYINLTVEALREVDQEISGLIAVAADVTEQVSARKKLEKVNNTLGLAIEAANMGIWQSDLKTGTLSISETARYIHGIPQDREMSYTNALEQLVVPEDIERMRLAIASSVKAKGRFNEDYQILPMNSSVRKWINSRGMVELNEFGEASSVIGTILDITERKEDELRKNDFIGMVSHELKTPLTSLAGILQLLTRKIGDTANEALPGGIERAHLQVKKMITLINGFLNISRLESGKIQLDSAVFNLTTLLSELVEEAALLSSGHHISIIQCPSISILGDRDKIGSVVSNLLSNAIKYSPKGKEIVVRCETDDAYVTVSVKDQGMGIKAQNIDYLFDRYYRVETNHTQNIAGFGIGLYLSAEIVKHHGGEIGVESESGVGSTFWFKLPNL